MSDYDAYERRLDMAEEPESPVSWKTCGRCRFSFEHRGERLCICDSMTGSFYANFDEVESDQEACDCFEVMV